MADIIETLRQKYLKEQQEYQDAVAAYEQMLNRVASSMPIPAAMQSNYSVASDGYLRAATDPWMLKNHPELAPLANKLGKEKGEYDKALDDYSAYVGNNKCGIGTYIGNRFYEYVALAEMVYMLSTNEEFRKTVVANLGEAVEEGGVISDFFLTGANGFSTEALAFTGGSPEATAGNEAMIAATGPAVKRFTDRVKAHFSERWNAFLKGWEECGLASAVQRAAIDGLFLVGEIVVGAVAIKGVKLSYNLTKEGLHRVEIMSVDTGKTVGERSWSAEALDAKYKAANDNHVGGILEERNQKIPDESADEMASKSAAAKKDNKKTGDIAEAAATERLKAEGYNDVRTLENNSGHGVDRIGRKSDGAVKTVEVKANSAGLNKLQREGGEYYLNKQLERATSGYGHWKSLPDGMEDVIDEVTKWVEQAPSKVYEIWKFDVDEATQSATFKSSTTWDPKPSKKKSSAVFREDDKAAVDGSDADTPRSTGPP